MGGYQYSFSGVDVTNVAWFDISLGGKEHRSNVASLSTLTTLSLSVHEAKSDVRSLGHRTVNGHTSAIRSIAGTMVMSIVDKHPFYSLITEYIDIKNRANSSWGYSRDSDRDGSGYSNVGSGIDRVYHSRLMPTTLAPFNMLFVAITEINDSALGVHNKDANFVGVNYATWALFGVEIIEESKIVSVNNILTEMSYTFKAQDYAVLEFHTGSVPTEYLKDTVLNDTNLIPATREGVDSMQAGSLTAQKLGYVSKVNNDNGFLGKSESLVLSRGRKS